MGNAKDLGFKDGIVERVDTLSQKYDGLETNINLREQKLDQKTQQYIAKLVDLNQIGQYLQSYVKTVNTAYVPTVRSLITTLQRGITVHSDEIAKDVINMFEQASGQSVASLINKTTYQELESSRHDAQQAKLDALLCAKVAKQSVLKFQGQVEHLRIFLIYIVVSLLMMLSAVLLTPGWWKLLTTFATITLVIGGALLLNYLLTKKDDEDDF